VADERKYDASEPGAAGEGSQPGLDVASRSLTNALRVSFRVLTIVALFLFVMLFLQGWQRIEPDKRVLVLRWGKAHRSRVYGEGSHWAWFYPIDEVHRFKIKARPLSVNLFWPKTSRKAKEDVVSGKKTPEDKEAPVLDAGGAFLLTGDLNVLESRWAITYRIIDAPEMIIKYYNHFGPDEIPLSEEVSRVRPSREADSLVRMALESAVVREIAHFEVLDAYGENKEKLRSQVALTVTKMVREMDCGIEVTPDSVKLLEVRPPKEVIGSFDAVKAAEQAVGTALKTAQTESNARLVAAAGDPYGPRLGETIAAWWKVKHAGDSAAMKEREGEIDKLLDSAGGDVAEIIVNAKADSTRIEEEAKADSKRLVDWTQNKSPETVRLYAELERIDAIQHVLERALEVMVIDTENAGGKSELEVILNRNPTVLKKALEVKPTR